MSEARASVSHPRAREARPYLRVVGAAAPRRPLHEVPRPADPRWSRPALIAVSALAGLLMTWGLARNANANSYYASAVLTDSRSWSAFWMNALDPSALVSVDKPPLSIWMMALSARIFGFSSLSMLLPNAACGVASVVVLHQTVKRSLGPRVAILSGLALALTPAVLAVSRFNNPDALLMLLLICAAWAATRAIESGRTRDVVICGAFLGLAFNTKMLQALLVVPAVGLAFQAAGPGSPRRRLGQLAIGTAAMVVLSGAWVGAMMLIPAGHRPWVGDTTYNSWWQLVFGANGVARLGGIPSASAAGGSPGLTRLFNAQNGGQVAWLMPLAAAGLLAGLWTTRRAHRRDRRRAALLMWGLWALVHFAVFALALNLFHPYYTSALAPAIAVLAAAGAVLLWDRAHDSRAYASGLAGVLLVTGAFAGLELRRSAWFVPWLAWIVAALAVVAAVSLGARALSPALTGRRWRVIAAIAGIVAALAGPTAYSLATLGHPVTGFNPTAGPAAPRSARGVARSPASAPLLGYLEAHRGSARYLVAASGSLLAAPIMLKSGRPVVTMGGFAGSDPAPTVNQLRRLIAAGQLRFVLLDSSPTGATGATGGAPGPSLGGRRTRALWVAAHCSPVRGLGGSATSARASQPQLYDCAGRG